MYVSKSFLSRLLGVAWTILLISVLLWVAASLLSEIWIWVVGIVAVVVVIRVSFWLWRFRRDQW